MLKVSKKNKDQSILRLFENIKVIHCDIMNSRKTNLRLKLMNHDISDVG